MEKWQYKIFLIFIICAIVIMYPFMEIKYFEIYTPNAIALKYFTPFTAVLTIIFGPLFYFKKVMPIDHVLKKKKKNGTISKRKEKARNFFSIFMMIAVSNMILYGLTFSIIVTTNSIFDNKKIIQVSEPVLNYYSDLTKNGRLRHYISIKSPSKDKIIDLEVDKTYQEGEIFRKKMKIGNWGILYSEE